MSRLNLTPQEVSERGRALYERSIRAHVEPDLNGRLLVLDVETAEYEVVEDGDTLSATRKLLARNPDAHLFELRVGHRAAVRLGMSADLSFQG